jgi:hypothetical protein
VSLRIPFPKGHVANFVIMCQYRYYYYAGCRHQETILMHCCPGALQPRRQQESSLDRGGASMAPGLESAHIEPAPEAPAPPSTLTDLSPLNINITPSPSTSTALTGPTSSSSILVSASDTSSLPAQLRQPFRRRSEATAGDMASLIAFSPSHWTQVILGTTTPPNRSMLANLKQNCLPNTVSPTFWASPRLYLLTRILTGGLAASSHPFGAESSFGTGR